MVNRHAAHVAAQARAAVRVIDMDAAPVAGGEAVRLAGLTKQCRVLHRESRVVNAYYALAIKPIDVPRFRACHEEARPHARVEVCVQASMLPCLSQAGMPA